MWINNVSAGVPIKLEAAAGIYVGDNPDLTGSGASAWDISHKINQAFTSRYGKKNIVVNTKCNYN